jgi:N-acetylglucosaminyldiphosphoundecaprenol N-acetyl-beta-D-mannosaminyltransferase
VLETESTSTRLSREPRWVWGLPLAPLTRAEAVEAAMGLAEGGRPSFFITANTHYAMLCHESPHLAEVNARAAFLLADGAPLVWASRLTGRPVPERVAGSDLIYDLCERAAERGHGVFLLGGAPGVADEAARRLTERFPGLRVVGTACPPFRELTAQEHQELMEEVRGCAPTILLGAFAMPRGEEWFAAHAAELGVPLCVNLGAAIDFVAGRVKRAPRRFQHLGLEWAYRAWLEPRRLAPRYARNARFLFAAVARDLLRGGRSARSRT